MTGLCDPRRSRHSGPSFAAEDPPLLDPRHGTTTVAAVTPASSPPRTLSSGKQQAGQSHDGTHSGHSFPHDSPHRRSTPAQATPPTGRHNSVQSLAILFGAEARREAHPTTHAKHTTDKKHAQLQITRRKEATGSSNGAVIQALMNGAHGVCGNAPYMMSRHVTGITRRGGISLPSVTRSSSSRRRGKTAPSAAPTCARRQGFSAVATSTCLGSTLWSQWSSCVLCGLLPCTGLRVNVGESQQQG